MRYGQRSHRHSAQGTSPPQRSDASAIPSAAAAADGGGQPADAIRDGRIGMRDDGMAAMCPCVAAWRKGRPRRYVSRTDRTGERRNETHRLGPRHLEQRHEGLMGPRRTGPAVRADRRRRRVRQDQYAGIPRHEPDRAGADACRKTISRLWESNAILRYLHARLCAPSPLFPAEPHARANVDRWMDAQQTVLNRPMGAVFWGLVRTPADKRDMAAIAQGDRRTRRRRGAWWRPN